MERVRTIDDLAELAELFDSFQFWKYCHAILCQGDPEARAEARLLLARIHRNRGSVQIMETHYRLLASESGTHAAKATWELGSEFESLGHWAEAETTFSTLIDRFPRSARRAAADKGTSADRAAGAVDLGGRVARATRMGSVVLVAPAMGSPPTSRT